MKQCPRELPVTLHMNQTQPLRNILKSAWNVETVSPGVAGQCAAHPAHEAPFRRLRNLIKSELHDEAVSPGVAGQCAAHAVNSLPNIVNCVKVCKTL